MRFENTTFHRRDEVKRPVTGAVAVADPKFTDMPLCAFKFGTISFLNHGHVQEIIHVDLASWWQWPDGNGADALVAGPRRNPFFSGSYASSVHSKLEAQSCRDIVRLHINFDIAEGAEPVHVHFAVGEFILGVE